MSGHFHLIDFGLSLDIDKIYSGSIEKKGLNHRYLKSMMTKIDGGRIMPQLNIIFCSLCFEQRDQATTT